MNLTELTPILRQNGIVGAGGAGFPTYVKLDKKADTLILNCAECEPLLKLHRQVLEKYAYEIVSTLEMIADAVEAKEVIIGIKPSYKKAVAAVEAVLSSMKKTKIGLLPEIYPAGDEVVLIYETTGRVVPPGNIPITVGVTVFNVETILNIYNAIHKEEPVISKYITVTGEVKNPVTLKVPLGITMQEVVDLAGGATVEDPVLINGGPMTGMITNPFDPVTKTTNAILVMPKDHYIVSKRTSKISIDINRAMSVCCQCRLCTDLCSRNLLGHPIEPHMFMRAASSGVVDDIKPMLNTMFCSACGLCELYSCFQDLSPRTLISAYKSGLRAKGVPIPKDSEFKAVAKDREFRTVPKSRLTARLGLAKYNFPAPLVETEIPAKKVKILLSQHIGAPAQALVKPKDKVKKGQLIASVADDKLGVSIHSSITGTVVEVNEKYIVIKA